MDDTTAARLVEINRQFYEEFGASFAATRRRLQDGVSRTLDRLPDEGDWLDVGCGGGALGVEWLRRGRRSRYLGVDFSEKLLSEARAAVGVAAATALLDGYAHDGLPSVVSAGVHGADALQDVTPDPLIDPLSDSPALPARATVNGGDALNKPSRVGDAVLKIGYTQCDLAAAEPFARLPQLPWRGVLAFAVLHHIPSHAWRVRLVRQIAALLDGQGELIHSVWQFQHSDKLMARRLAWERVGLCEDVLEAGDTLLDWRAQGQDPSAAGLRYVHLFDRAELESLAQAAGMQIVDEFESDGQGGRLGLYQVWKKR